MQSVRILLFVAILIFFSTLMAFALAAISGRKPQEVMQPVQETRLGVEQVKIFPYYDLNKQEIEINEWLSKNHGKIEIVRSFVGESKVYIFYKKIG